MRRLISILVVGLLMPPLTHSQIPEDEVIKLCEPDYVIKLIELCQKLKTDVNHLHVGIEDPLQALSNVEYIKDKYMKKIKSIFDRDRIQQLQMHNAQQPIYDQYNQNEPMPKAGYEFVSETRQDSIMQPAKPRKVNNSKMSQKQFLYSELCCVNGCTKAVILTELCFWAK